ncbi:MAG: hypothetical protein QF701_03380 [Nitrospinota bacterium]|nr:hypothetical protein [Nitrospinota bacterium]MDP7370523.1 hypothetical protein [Nitrospinota bacterium]
MPAAGMVLTFERIDFPEATSSMNATSVRPELHQEYPPPAMITAAITAAIVFPLTPLFFPCPPRVFLRFDFGIHQSPVHVSESGVNQNAPEAANRYNRR